MPKAILAMVWRYCEQEQFFFAKACSGKPKPCGGFVLFGKGAVAVN